MPRSRQPVYLVSTDPQSKHEARAAAPQAASITLMLADSICEVPADESPVVLDLDHLYPDEKESLLRQLATTAPTRPTAVCTHDVFLDADALSNRGIAIQQSLGPRDLVFLLGAAILKFGATP